MLSKVRSLPTLLERFGPISSGQRVRRIEETRQLTKAELSRTLNTMQSQHTELIQSHSSTAHASEIAKLDTQKFRTAKAASDAEVEAERAAQQAADLAARLAELEIQGVEGDPAERSRRRDPVDDEILLRLKVYRSLGIDLERDGRDGLCQGRGAQRPQGRRACGEYGQEVFALLLCELLLADSVSLRESWHGRVRHRRMEFDAIKVPE